MKKQKFQKEASIIILNQKIRCLQFFFGDELDKAIGEQIPEILGQLSTKELLNMYVDILVKYHEKHQTDIISKYWETLPEYPNPSASFHNRSAYVIMKKKFEKVFSEGVFNNKNITDLHSFYHRHVNRSIYSL